MVDLHTDDNRDKRGSKIVITCDMYDPLLEETTLLTFSKIDSIFVEEVDSSDGLEIYIFNFLIDTLMTGLITYALEKSLEIAFTNIKKLLHKKRAHAEFLTQDKKIIIKDLQYENGKLTVIGEFEIIYFERAK